jgi:hypothetical protein
VISVRNQAGFAACALCAFATLCACGWPHPPLTHALEVRNLQSKCALIWFSGCTALLPESSEPDGDAGTVEPDDSDAGVAEP